MVASINPVSNFDQLSFEEAVNILYHIVVPACEAKGVKLSSYGNHTGTGSVKSVEVYNQKKAGYALFNVAKVQKVFRDLDAIIIPKNQYKSGSYDLKQSVAKYQDDSLSNGDLIAAMLLKGFKARFAKKGQSLSINCEFKAAVKG